MSPLLHCNPKFLLTNCCWSTSLCQMAAMERKLQTGPLPHCHSNAKQICSAFGKSLPSDRYFTILLGMHDGPVKMFLGKLPGEFNTPHSQVHASRCCSSQAPLFPLCSPQCLSCWAGFFLTQWVHLSRQALCEKKVPQSNLSISQG